MILKTTRAAVWQEENTRQRIQKWKMLQHKKYLVIIILSVVVMSAAMIIYYVVVPSVSRIIITKLRELRNGSIILSKWEHQPVPLITRVFLWNLTNPQEVSAGLSNPIFTEVGPYVYEQFTEKIPLAFKEDSIVYNSRTLYQFLPEQTAPRTLEDTVVTLQAGLYGAASLMESMAPSMMSLVDDAVPYLFPGLDSIFVTVRVGSYLFDGIALNCSNVAGTTAQLICNVLPSHAPPTIRKLENSPDYVYSFLAHKNNTLKGPYEENRGLQDIYQVGALLSFEGKKEIGVWELSTRCDQLRGTDSQTFAPFVQKTDVIEIYIHDVCQVVPLHFKEEGSLQGLTVFKFVLKEWLNSSLPENSCYCDKESNNQFCQSDGLRDISACMKAPVVISLPHFYMADEQFRSYAQGMKPNNHLHTSVLYIEPQTGSPVKAAKRIQFNMYLKQIVGFTLVQNVTEGLFPLVWMEESISLSEEVLWPVKLPLLIQWLVNIACVLVGLMCLVVACSALIAFVYESKWCCFRHVTSNQVAAIFYRSSPEESGTPKINVHTLGHSLYSHTEHSNKDGSKTNEK